MGYKWATRIMKKVLIRILVAIPLVFLFLSCENNVNSPQNDVGEEAIIKDGGDVYFFNLIRFTLQGNQLVREDDKYNDVEIVDVGKINSLSNIEYVPPTGWQSSVTLVVGNGYIVKRTYRNNPLSMFARFRVIERIDKGAVTGYRIRIQDDWDPLTDAN